LRNGIRRPFKHHCPTGEGGQDGGGQKEIDENRFTRLELYQEKGKDKKKGEVMHLGTQQSVESEGRGVEEGAPIAKLSGKRRGKFFKCMSSAERAGGGFRGNEEGAEERKEEAHT